MTSLTSNQHSEQVNTFCPSTFYSDRLHTKVLLGYVGEIWDFGIMGFMTFPNTMGGDIFFVISNNVWKIWSKFQLSGILSGVRSYNSNSIFIWQWLMMILTVPNHFLLVLLRKFVKITRNLPEIFSFDPCVTGKCQLL